MPAAKELQLRIDLINKTAEIERAQDGLTAAKREIIQINQFKAISDLTKKYSIETSETDVNTTIAGINKKLAVVEKGSEDELKLQKELIDNKAAIDILSAQKSILNAKDLANKITEIQTKQRLDDAKADDAFLDKQLHKQLKAIDLATQRANVPLQNIASDPGSTTKEKQDANRQILENDFIAINQQMDAVQQAIKSSKGDVTSLKAELASLEVKGLKISGDLFKGDSKDTVENIKKLSKYADLIDKSFHSLGSALEPINKELADALNTMGDMVGQAAKLAINIASAKPDPAAIASGSIALLGSVIKVFTASKESRDKAAAEMADYQQKVLDGEININLQYRERLRQQVEINKLKLQGINDEQDLLRKQRHENANDYQKILQDIQQQQYISGQHTEKSKGSALFGLVGYFAGIGATTKTVNDFSSLAGKSYEDLEKLFNSGQLTDKAQALFGELQKLKQEGADIDSLIEQNKEKAKEIFTGTTADSITSSIVDGFANGFTSVEQFAGKTEDIIRGAMLRALSAQALDIPIKKLYEQFAIDAQSGGGLDTTEVANFTESINKTISDAALFAEQIQKATGVSLNNATQSNQNSLKGAIEGITAKQADLLDGTIGGLRLTALDQLYVAQSSLRNLQNIDNNTAAAVRVMSDYYRTWSVNGLKVNIA